MRHSNGQAIKITAVVLVMTICTVSSHAQEMLGMTIGDYAGIHAGLINPAGLYHSRYYLDINLVSAGIFLENNYLYQSAKDYSFRNFFKSGYSFPMHTSEYAIGERPFYTFDSPGDKFTHTQVRIIGPSVLLVSGKHAFALQTAMRSMMVIRDLPEDMANFFYYGLEYTPQYNIQYRHPEDYHMATMVWSEVGLSWAMLLRKRYGNAMTAGISAKLILGHAGTYFNGYQTDYSVPNGHDIDIADLDAEMGYSLPIDYSSNDFFYGDPVKGTGLAMDLGFTYTKSKKISSYRPARKVCEAEYEDYLYRIGFSVLDLGWVHFSSNALTYKYEHSSAYWENADSIIKTYKSVNDFSRDLSRRFCGSPTCAQNSREFTMMMPFALSLQYDYHIYRNYYLNATAIHPVRLYTNYLYRPSVFALIPRFESTMLGISLPLSLYDWREPRLGAAIRIYNFTVGTEKLSGLLGFNDFSGMDLYFSIRISFLKGHCPGSWKNYYCPERPFRSK